MDFRKAYGQRENALYRVFFMLAAFLVMTVRAGYPVPPVVLPGRDVALLPAPEGPAGLEPAQLESAPSGHDHAASLRPTIDTLLQAIYVAAHRLMSSMRHDYELMTQPSSRPPRVSSAPAGQHHGWFRDARGAYPDTS